MNEPLDLPPNTQTVIPHLVCQNAAEMITFCHQAFGAEEMMRLLTPDGRIMHAAIGIGDCTVMLVDEFPEQCSESRGPKALHGSPVTIHVYVADVDATVDRAVAAGATVTLPVQDMFWGDRYGQFEDPQGHRWSVATPQRKVDPSQLQQMVTQMFSAPSS